MFFSFNIIYLGVGECIERITHNSLPAEGSVGFETWEEKKSLAVSFSGEIGVTEEHLDYADDSITRTTAASAACCRHTPD